MKILKYLTIIIALLLVSSIVFAGATTVPEDGKPVLCPRETGTFSDVIWNTGASTEEISITLSGGAAKWASVTPSGFFLAPGQKKTIYSYVTPKSDAAPGEYVLNINVQTNNEKKTIAHEVIVDNCFEASVSGDIITKQVCPGGSATYELYLVNAGKYQEGFSLEVQGSATLSDDRAYLAPGNSKTFYVYTTAPKQEGDYGITVTATGDSGKSVDSFNYVLEVLPCYDFIVNVEGNNNYEICDHTLVEIPVSVKNIGTVSQNYDVEFSGANWGIVNKDNLNLLPNEEKEVVLTFTPDYEINGDFNFQLEIVPEYGDKKAVSEFNFNVKDCNDVSLELDTKALFVCNSGVDRSFTAVVKNNGEFTKEYKLDIKEDVEWVNLGNNIFTLGPDQEISKTILLAPGMDISGKVDLTVGVGSLDDANEFASETIKVDVLSGDECFDSEIEIANSKVIVYKDSSVVVPVIISNNGKEIANYELSLTGTANDFVMLNPSTLTLDANEEGETYLYIAPNVDTAEAEFNVDVALKLVGEGVLDSDDLKIKITNDVTEATELEGAEEVNSTGFWTGIGNWFGDLFSSSEEVNVTSHEVNNTLENSTVTGSKFWDGVKDYKYYILGIIIVLLVIVILVRIGFFEKLSEFFLNEDSEEEEETPKAKTPEQKEADEIKKAVSGDVKKKVVKKVKK